MTNEITESCNLDFDFGVTVKIEDVTDSSVTQETTVRWNDYNRFTQHDNDLRIDVSTKQESDGNVKVCHAIYLGDSELDNMKIQEYKVNFDDTQNIKNELISVTNTYNDNRQDVRYEENDGFICDHCNFNFSSKTNLLRHIKNRLISPGRDTRKDPKCGNKNNMPVKKVNNTFQTRLTLCTVCMKNVSNIKRHMNTHTNDKNYGCKKCEKSYTQSNDLQEHMRKHTGEKPFVCDYCDKAFISRSKLTRHRRVHTGEKPYQCNTCNARFSYLNTYTSHTRAHVGDKRYRCEVCDKRFLHRVSLVKHLRVHSGERPYKCKFCSKSFSTAFTLQGHIRTHTGEKPYKCTICDKRYAQKNCLSCHMRTHHKVEKSDVKNVLKKSLEENRLWGPHIDSKSGQNVGANVAEVDTSSLFI